MTNFLKSRTIQGAVIGIIGLLAVTVLTLTFPYWNPFAQPSATVQRYFAPEYGVAVDTRSLSAANCWIHSVVSDRPDAYRCSTDDGLIDPCFTSGTEPSILACPINPYDQVKYYSVEDSQLEQLAVASSTGDQPWFIKLNDGTECNFDSGATSLVAGMRVDYMCNNNKYSGLLLPITNDGKVDYINCYIGTTISSCAIKETWY